jgi:polar amino acid transport system permease protein
VSVSLPLAVQFDWSLFAHQVFAPDSDFGRALLATLYISVTAQVTGVLLGLASALAGMSRLRALRALSGAYVLLVRGTPLIVQIFFVYFGANLFLGFTLFPRSIDLGGLEVSGAVIAGTAALAINEGAYMSEIIRAGIGAVDRGQMESGLSLGLTRRQAMRRIVLPQAARTIVPPLGNEFNNMMKTSSLLAFIGVYEIFGDAQARYAATFQPVEYFAAAAVWYMLLTAVWSLVQARIERRLSVGDQERRPSRMRLRRLSPARREATS